MYIIFTIINSTYLLYVHSTFIITAFFFHYDAGTSNSLCGILIIISICGNSCFLYVK